MSDPLEGRVLRIYSKVLACSVIFAGEGEKIPDKWRELPAYRTSELREIAEAKLEKKDLQDLDRIKRSLRPPTTAEDWAELRRRGREDSERAPEAGPPADLHQEGMF